MRNSLALPDFIDRSRITNSAIGERQMLPWQTKRMRVGVDMRRAPLLAVDIRAGRIAYVVPLENAVNPCEQPRLDGKGRPRSGILAGIFGKKAFFGQFLPQGLPGVLATDATGCEQKKPRNEGLETSLSETLPLNPQHLLAHVLESQVGVDVVRGRYVRMPHDVLEPRRAHAVSRHAGREAV